jgi:predicted kinase
MPTLTIVAGLPGSGKSRLLDAIQAMFPGLLVVHDFHLAARSEAVADSVHLAAVDASLRKGNHCVIADIEFCRAHRRKAVEEHFRHLATIECLCFENDPIRCIQNILRRDRPDKLDEIQKCLDLHRVYAIPPRAQVIGVAGC